MCELLGVGLDLCAVERMREHVSDRFLERYFTREEAAYVRGRGAHAAESLAGLWAAKEAVSKALGTGLAFPLDEIEIGHTPTGQPVVCLHGQAALAAHGGSFLLSITHDAGAAAAVAIWLGSRPDAEPA